MLVTHTFFLQKKKQKKPLVFRGRLPVVVVKQFDGHVAAPLLMPGFVDLPEAPGADHLPVRQAGVLDQHGDHAAGQCHSSLQGEVIQVS